MTKKSSKPTIIKNFLQIFLIAAIAFSLVGVQPIRQVAAQTEFAWLAYNDCAGTTGGNTTAIAGVSGSGTLKNYDSGTELTGITATFTSTGDPSVIATGQGAYPASGTDAYTTFYGKANMVGMVQYGDSGYYIDLTFAGLDPLKSYTFAATANRNSGSYTDRVSRFTLSGDLGATNASSSGVTEINDHSVYFSTGNNGSNGYVARWTGIHPSSTGSFIVSVQEQTAGNKGYGMSVFMLAEEIGSTPSIFTTGSLSPFNSVVGTPSAEQFYSVSGVNLTDAIHVVAPTDFEVSLTSGGPWEPSVDTAAPDAGVVASTPIYVRLNPTSVTTYSANIANFSDGAIGKDVAVTGSSVPTITTSVSSLPAFATPPGIPSADQTDTVSGVNLTNSIDISSIDGFQISSNGTTWLDTLTFSQSEGVVTSTTIHVRMTGVDEGDFGGNIGHASSGATTMNVAVTGTVALIPERVTKQVNQSSDDAEERVSGGTVDNNSTDLELVYDSGTGSNQQIVGMRFQDIQVPPGASIQNAYIEFTAKDTESTTVDLTISGQDDPNPSTFPEETSNLSSRVQTTAEVSWAPGAWTSGSKYTTPDLKTIVQEIVDKGDWAAGNAMVLFVEGTSATTKRNAQSYDESSHTKGPTLVIDYFESDAPTIITSGTLTPFSTTQGSPSESQTYTVEGSNLENNIDISAPGGFEISTDNATYLNILTLTVPTGGTLDPTTIYVRMTGTDVGTFSGNIAHVSSPATQKDVAVSGDVLPADLFTVVLQEELNGYAGTLDTYIYDVDPTVARGAETTIVQDKNTSDERRSLLQFDLSAIPPTATISSAELQFYVDAEGQGFTMHLMLKPWDELITYSSNGGHFNADDDDAQSSANVTWPGNDGFTGSITLSVPAATIQNWVNDSMDNNGWLMIATHADDGQQLRSSEHGTQSDRPKLTIEYTQTNTNPDAPVLVQPLDNATGVAMPPTLEVTVTDADEDAMDVSFYGREVSTEAPAEDFLFVAIPDTQSNAQYNNTVLQAQFDWIENRYVSPPAGEPDLVFVTHLGDLVNSATDPTQWSNIDSAFDQLDPVGAPYSVGPGNHDLGTLYSTNFGNSRFTGKTWYQGYYTSGTDNYNNYSFFSAGGMDFIVINLQYQVTSGALDWADALLKANTTKRGIVVQHDILNLDNSWNNQAAYTALSDNPNLFLMLCGHMHSASDGSAYRLETRSGMQSVHVLLTDYQDLSGQDFLRLLTFKPSTDVIYAQVYSPVTPGGYKTSESNYEQFTMAYEMEGTAEAPYVLIGTDEDVASGANASVIWTGLSEDTEYEWYAVVDDGSTTTTGPTWSFTTAGGVVNQPPVVTGIPDQTITEGSSFATIALDNYVADPDNTDTQMTWTYSGNTALTVSIVDRVATIGIPNVNWNGSETITFRATDPGSLFDEESAIFTVTAVNDAPVITGQAQILTVPEETDLEILLAHINVTDVDNDYPDDFTLTVLSGTNYQINGNTITPDTGFYGELTVPVKINDGLADSNTYDLTVTVTQGGVTPVLPSSFWGLLHFVTGDDWKPVVGDSLYAYLDSETIPITSVLIGSDGSDLTYAINVPAYPNGTHPTTVRFTAGGPTLGIANWSTGTNVQFNLHPPLPNAGGPYVTQASIGSISLAGSVSDWGNDVATTQWDLDEDGSYDDASVLNPTFTFASAGTYPVHLKAVDSQGGQGNYTSNVFAITLSGHTGQVYNGSAHPVTVDGIESPFSYNVLYNSSATPPTNAGTYTVLVQILSGTEVITTYETSMVIAKATATVSLGNLSHTYDGTVKAASATTTPAGLTVDIIYNPANPINAGNYAVTATIVDSNYQGSTTGTLVIARATQAITVTTNAPSTAVYNSTFTVAATATSGLTVTYTSGSPSVCSVSGTTFTMLSGTGTCLVQYDQAGNDNFNPATQVTENTTASKVSASVILSNLNQTYDGNPKPITVTTDPEELSVIVTYDGSSTPPSAAGSYAVVATVNDNNYEGFASGTLVISGLSHSIDLVAGWNLVSFNLTLADTDIADVLAGILDDVILVYGWDGETDTWMRFDPEVEYGNTLTTIDETMGFWINMGAPRTLTVLGTAPTTTNITLYEGWNLIGWPSDGSTALPAALAAIEDNYDLVLAYHANDSADPWKLFDPEAPAYANDLLEMAPGWGYWINMVADDSLAIGY